MHVHKTQQREWRCVCGEGARDGVMMANNRGLRRGRSGVSLLSRANLWGSHCWWGTCSVLPLFFMMTTHARSFGKSSFVFSLDTRTRRNVTRRGDKRREGNKRKEKSNVIWRGKKKKKKKETKVTSATFVATTHRIAINHGYHGYSLTTEDKTRRKRHIRLMVSGAVSRGRSPQRFITYCFVAS